jgi:hypothetical protein
VSIFFGAGGVPLYEITPLIVPVGPLYGAASAVVLVFVPVVLVFGPPPHAEPRTSRDSAIDNTSQTFVCLFMINSSKLR